mgnify:CR=1 FL=1
MEKKAILALERYLHRHIPVSKAMRVKVMEVVPDRVVLRAPLSANRNHQGTAFGGSLSTLAILAAWSLIHARLKDERVAHRLVIRRHTMEYQRPVTGPLIAHAILFDPADWPAFVRALREKGKARLAMLATLLEKNEPAAHFEGDFVALTPEEIVYGGGESPRRR